MGLNETPRANRLHIGIFGKRNSGKSSLINALTGQEVALVSDHPGTTTDPVFKAMELHPIGPVVFIDTAGFDDEGELGNLRIGRTKETIQKTDIGIVVFADDDFEEEVQWIRMLKEAEIPIIPVINKIDRQGDWENLADRINNRIGIEVVLVSAMENLGLGQLRSAIEQAVPGKFHEERILDGMIEESDLVLLVMPQDIQAPKGRLILPQVQTLRELLDSRCTAICTTADMLPRALAALAREPDLIITDSQCFGQVYQQKPESAPLTSFSVLFAAYKGDIDTFVSGADTVDKLNEHSRVLIAEACTHAPLSEDIGREKIPALLKKKYGEMQIDLVSGNDFPVNLSDYDLIIHCGACMFNRKHVLSRIAMAKDAGVPISNYGIVMAKLSGILNKIQLPHNIHS